jgi:hypothetical protein
MKRDDDFVALVACREGGHCSPVHMRYPYKNIPHPVLSVWTTVLCTRSIVDATSGVIGNPFSEYNIPILLVMACA